MHQHDTLSLNGISQPVLRIALGTWAMGGWQWGGPDDKSAVSTIHQALDEGINLIDTAPVYGLGILKKSLEKHCKTDVTKSLLPPRLV